MNSRRWIHLLLLLSWVAIGAALRFTHLTEKPPWTDEFSTIVFGLGNSFSNIPLNQPIAIETLLKPLQPNARGSISSVLNHLLTESNHPPLYFVLTHLWLKLFPTSDGLASLWGVRSLAALFGVLTIPASFGLGWLAFRSRLVGHFAAALMAVSPFAIYLSQEARHYTLPMLWIMASLACLIIALRSMNQRKPFPIWVCLLWIIVNGLGIATHYFFSVTLMAEGLLLMAIGFLQMIQAKEMDSLMPYWWRIGSVAAGTAAAGVAWVPIVQNVQDSELTRWIYRGDRSGFAWLEPLGQAIAGWITMIYLLPIQSEVRWIAIASIVGLLLLTVWTIPPIYRGLRAQGLRLESRLGLWTLGGVVLGAIALFLGVSYSLGMDVTSGFRYNFVYFPAAIVLIGASLASHWAGFSNATPSQGLARLLTWSGRSFVAIVLLLSLLGGLTVITNLGYQKTHRPDVVAQAIEQRSQHQPLIAIVHRTHGQTGRLMGIAWELRHWQERDRLQPLFLLAHQDRILRAPIATLRQTIRALPKPLDLWLINYRNVPQEPLNALLQRQRCIPDADARSVDGYRYQLFRCIGRQG